MQNYCLVNLMYELLYQGCVYGITFKVFVSHAESRCRDFQRDVTENSGLLGCDAASLGVCFQKFGK